MISDSNYSKLESDISFTGTNNEFKDIENFIIEQARKIKESGGFR